MPCQHETFESRVLVRPVPETDPTRPTPGRYQVLLQVRCAAQGCGLPLVFELPVVGAQIGFVPAGSQSSDGQEASLAAHLVAPVLNTQAAVPWQAVPTVPERDEDAPADDQGVRS